MILRLFSSITQRYFVATLLCGSLAGCGYVDYDKAPEGTFKGALFVMWIGEGGNSGDGRFVYVPDQNDPLRFIRGDGPAKGQEIIPEMMYTDGGSIPKQVQLFKGFSPWGYAPAYMVHDWIFVARHCITDGQANPREQEISKMSFQDSAEITAEMIKTLIKTNRVSENDVAPRVISGTVAGPISYQRWKVQGACTEDRVSPEHRARAESAIFAPRIKSLELEPGPVGDGTVQLITTLRF